MCSLVGLSFSRGLGLYGLLCGSSSCVHDGQQYRMGRPYTVKKYEGRTVWRLSVVDWYCMCMLVWGRQEYINLWKAWLEFRY